MKHVSLELGGKNPLVICRDADLETAVRGAVAGMNFAWAGQSCGSTSRILVHESVYDRAVELAKAEIERIRVGDPLDMASQMGPLNSAVHAARVKTFVEAGKAENARLVTGGGLPQGVDPRGFWLQPTLFADVTPEMRLAREEVFGPVMSFMRWSTEDEAIRIANSTPYGLTASIYGRDINTVMRMAKQIEAGVVAVNTTKMHFVGMPFGGVKDSGVGGEENLEELLSYTQTKAIHINL